MENLLKRGEMHTNLQTHTQKKKRKNVNKF